MKPLTIGALADRAGVGVETIRFYERKGLVRRPARPGAGFRVYPEDAVGRIRFIRQAQALGFTLQEIGGLLALRVTPGSDCAAVRTRAVAKRAIVQTRLAELERIRDALDKLIAACPGRGAVTTCTILEALAQATGMTPDTRPRRNARSKAMKSLELKIQGMHCDGCAGTIESLLAREPGVKGASVSYAAGKGQILYDPAATDPARVAAAIERAGYRVAADPTAS
ncbi:MAG: MerR family DNA-binding protein [Burkholderiales bacterium]|nr:MerR family DNA-binding protein [Burkholderiales bacterium]